MNELNGQEIMGRPAKINPGVKKSFSAEPRAKSYDRTPERGNRFAQSPQSSKMTLSEYLGSRRYVNTSSDGYNKPASERWPRNDSSSNWNRSSEQNRRIYVGGLPSIETQSMVESEMQKLFDPFQLQNVGKLISPHPSKQGEPGNHHYLFIDMASSVEADEVIQAMNGKELGDGGQLRVSKAKGESRRVPREQNVEGS